MELTIEQALQKAVAAHKEGKLQEAEHLYRAILQSQPLHPDANHNLGLLAVSVNRVDAALPLFKNALDANPKTEQFWLSYIEALIKEKQFVNAGQVIEKATGQGVARDALDALKAQLVALQKSEESNRVRPTRQQLDKLLNFYQAGQYGDAEILALTITQEFPQYQYCWKVLAAIYAQTGRKSEAVDANSKAVELSPKDAEAHSNLGVTLKELGRLDEAQASYARAIALKPDYVEAHNNLGNTLKELGNLDEAEASYMQAIALRPDYAEAHNNLGSTLKELGRLDEAAASFNRAIALKPDFAEAHSNMGVVYQELGRLDEAEASLRQAVVLRPDSAEALSNLGVTLIEQSKFEEAEADLRKAVALRPDYAEAHCNLANALKELRRLSEAEASYEQAIALNSNFAEAQSNLGVTLRELGKLDEAVIHLERALSLKSNFADAMLNLSAVLDDMNKSDAAIDMLQSVLKTGTESARLTAGVRLGILQFLEGDLAESKKSVSASAQIQDKQSQGFRNDRIYQSYLMRILDWHENNSADSSNIENGKTLYIVGESHCLTGHRLRFQSTDSSYTCKSKLVMGCKQWHLGNSSENKYKRRFENILNSLPESSELLLTIGEIDCRLDEGILRHKFKNPENSIDELVQTTIDGFLDYVVKISSRLRHNIIVQGVPCPNIPTENLAKQGVVELVELIRLFNSVLQREAKNTGFGFLDVHSLTDRGDGFSNSTWHIDEFHLSPQAILQALDRYHSK